MDNSQLEAAHYLLRPFMLRRVKDEVECRLPPKVETRLNCPLSEFQTFWYRRLLLRDVDMLRAAEQDNGQGMLSKILNIRYDAVQSGFFSNGCCQGGNHTTRSSTNVIPCGPCLSPAALPALSLSRTPMRPTQHAAAHMTGGGDMGGPGGPGGGRGGGRGRGRGRGRRPKNQELDEDGLLIPAPVGSAAAQWTKMMNLLMQLRKVRCWFDGTAMAC